MKILGIDIGGTSIKLGISDATGNITDFKEFSSEAKCGGPHLVKRLIQKVKDNYSSFDAVGISTAGQVNSVDGTIYYANENIPHYTGTPLKQIFEKEFGVPVQVENDVNAAALGEKKFGAGKNYNDFLCLTYGTGIGGAIIVDSNVYKGYNGSAAEFGHIILHPEGEKCGCGSVGCYEMYASTTALVKQALKINSEYSNGRRIFEALAAGDKPLANVRDQWVLEVAYGLVSLIHIFNPPAIIVGGGVMEQEQLVAMVEVKVKELIMESFADVEILKARLGNRAGLLGAVSLHL